MNWEKKVRYLISLDDHDATFLMIPLPQPQIVLHLNYRIKGSALNFSGPLFSTFATSISKNLFILGKNALNNLSCNAEIHMPAAERPAGRLWSPAATLIDIGRDIDYSTRYHADAPNSFWPSSLKLYNPQGSSERAARSEVPWGIIIPDFFLSSIH